MLLFPTESDEDEYIKQFKSIKCWIFTTALGPRDGWPSRTDPGTTVPGTYVAAVADFTETVSPSAVPVTLAFSQASSLSLFSMA